MGHRLLKWLLRLDTVSFNEMELEIEVSSQNVFACLLACMTSGIGFIFKACSCIAVYCKSCEWMAFTHGLLS